MSSGANRIFSLAFFVLLAAFAGIVLRRELADRPGGEIPTSVALSPDIDHWTCTMHPSVRKAGPGSCPICGMPLLPVTKAQREAGLVLIDDARRQLIGVRTGPVIEGPMQTTFRAVGQVAYDESKLSDVNLKVQGFITKLFVSRTGQRVAQGQPLFSVYSPELYNAQQDFLLATKGASAAMNPAGSAPGLELGRAARQRLHLLGLSDAQVASIEKSGVPAESITISSPASGFVIEKDVVEGASIEPGMRLFRIAALNRVWVEADIYEADLGHVRVGQSVTVTLDYLPGKKYEAKIAYVYPYLEAKNRTGRVRVELSNKELELRPGMYANIELEGDARPKLQVPASAVVYTGPRRLVFRDLGQGRFVPQEVRIGAQADGMYEVVAGLQAGDSVATSGVFLIAAEARISTAAKYWEDAQDEGGTHDDTAASASPPMPASMPSPAKAPLRQSVPKPVHAVAPPPAHSVASSTDVTDQAKAQMWTCVMHPEIRSPAPGKCPICGMTLVPLGAPK